MTVLPSLFCVPTLILALWLPTVSSAMNEYGSLLSTELSTVSCQNKYGSTVHNQTACLRSLPMDCWKACLEYISSPRSALSFRRLSISHLQLYEDAMKRAARKYKHLLSESNIGTEPESMARILKSMILIPGGTLDVDRFLNRSELISYFYCIHYQSSKHMITGIDSSSGHPFLSIVLRHDDNDNHHLILLLVFGPDDFLKVRGFIDFEAPGDSCIYIHICLFELEDLVQLLEQEYMTGWSFRYDITWTMESRFKQLTRQNKGRCIRCCKWCGKQIGFAMVILLVIALYWIWIYVLIPHNP